MPSDSTYLGDCTWKPVAPPESHDPPNELPTTTEAWIGRSDQTDDFLTAKAIASAYLGGFIVDRQVRANGFCPGMDSCEILVARPPNFDDSRLEISSSTKTVTKKVIVETTTVFSGATAVQAVRQVACIVHESSYHYFTPTMPTAPRFTTEATGQNPRILRDTVTVSITAPMDQVDSREYDLGPWAQLPAVLRTPLDLQPLEVDSAFSAELIPGTPWFRCCDVVAREFKTMDTP